VTPPAFILASDLLPHQPDWTRALAQAESLVDPVARILGFAPNVRLASLATHPGEDSAGENGLDRVLDGEAQSGASEIFVLPASLDWSMWQREALGRAIAEFRRRHGNTAVFHDDIDPGHPLLVEFFADAIVRALAGAGEPVPPQRAGLLLVASGHGDTGSRAHSYRLMRLLWEQLSLASADVAFLRHPRVFLSAALERCAREPLHWVLVPQSQWSTEHCDYATTILEDFVRAHPESSGWPLALPRGDHSSVSAWFAQRMTRLWQERRAREAVRTPSRKSAGAECGPRIWSGREWEPVGVGNLPCTGWIVKTASSGALRAVLDGVLPKSDTFFVKVTWHGYATGTYTDPAALDMLLDALPGRAILLEGHTSSRNLGGATWDWETEAQNHRAWIRQQEMEYLRRTGLAEVIAQHRAEYVNVTEAYWDGACAPAAEIEALLSERGVALRHPELAGFVPESFLAARGAPFLSFARFKGPTRLSISNLFGLIPAPLRSAWHGPDITHFASVCCDIAKLYSCLFSTFGLVEALHSAVRWDRKGLYRSRWGNYDLVLSDGIVTLSEGLAGADILASRLQGQDVSRSAFFDVVKLKLEWPESATTQSLPLDVQTRFA
jgi:sirohydrochlorin ferrochelatase